MKNDQQADGALTRRDFLKTAGAGAVALGLGLHASAAGAASAASMPSPPSPPGSRGAGPYNILFILTDQERFFRPGEHPAGFSLPAHERLAKQAPRF